MTHLTATLTTATGQPRDDIPGDGIRYRRYPNSELVRQDQADAVRQNLEIRHSAPYRPVRWSSVGVPSGFVQLGEISDPSAPSANTGRLFVRDNGSGKSQLCVRFASGAVQVIATEP